MTKEERINEFRELYHAKLTETNGHVKRAYEAAEAVFVEKYGASHYKNYQSFSVAKTRWPKVNN